MAILTKAQLKTENDDVIKVNGVRAITAPLHHQLVEDIIDSLFQVNSISSRIQDTNNDTYVDTESTPNGDVIVIKSGNYANFSTNTVWLDAGSNPIAGITNNGLFGSKSIKIEDVVNNTDIKRFEISDGAPNEIFSVSNLGKLHLRGITSADRDLLISLVDDGELIFNVDTNKFQYYDHNTLAWVDLGGGDIIPSRIQNADNDTFVDTEKTLNGDFIVSNAINIDKHSYWTIDDTESGILMSLHPLTNADKGLKLYDGLNLTLTNGIIDMVTGTDSIGIGNGVLSGANPSNSIAIGRNALRVSSTSSNIGIGIDSLYSNTNGQNNIAIGFMSLYSNVDGSQNIAIGDESFYSNQNGNFNVAIGTGTLYSNVSGSKNTAVGVGSLYSNTVGENNTAIGYSSLQSNIDGTDNTAVGCRSLFSNTTGYGNTSIGCYSLNNNIDGSQNISLGNQSLYNNTSGNDNVAIGVGSLYNNSIGIDNIAVGNQSLYFNTDGYNNVAIGKGVLYNNTSGYYNIAIGTDILYSNTIGYDNIGIGNSSLYNNITGYENIALGDGSLFSNIDGDDNVAIGFSSLYSNTTGNYNIAMGINSLYYNNAGYQNTAIGNSSLVSNTNGYRNVAVGDNTLDANTTGFNNTAFGYQALNNNSTGLRNTAVGAESLATSNYNNCTGLGSNSSVTGSNQVQLGDSATTTYAYGAVQNRSDIRDKAEIRDTLLGLDFINKLRPVDFKWNYREDYYTTEEVTITNPNFDSTKEVSETNTETIIKKVIVKNANNGTKVRTRFHQGLIAQEVKAVITEIGIDFGGYQDHSVKDGEDVMSLGYSELIAPLIKAVQELTAKNTALELRILALETV